MNYSLNNRLIVEAPPAERGLKQEVKNGFAFIGQKLHLKGLKVLVDAKVTIGTEVHLVKAGSVAYFKEEELYTQPWAKKVLEDQVLGSQILIVDLSNVQYISDSE